MLYILVAVVIVILFLYLGLGLSLLIVPTAWRRYTLLIAPTIGFCFATLVGWVCYVNEFRGTDTYAPLCLAAAAVPLAIAVWREWRRRGAVDPLLSRELAAPLLVGLIGFLLTSAPLLTSSGEMTSYSFGNSDIADSAAISSYLKEHQRSSQEGFLGQSPVLSDLANRAIFGGCLSTALPASLLHLKPYQLQTMSVHLHFMFGVLVMYVVARELFHYGHAGATLVCALYATSPVMFFTVCQGYQGQMVATGVALLIILVYAQAVRSPTVREVLPLIPLAVLLTWGFSLSYPHMVFFGQAPVVGYVGFTCLRTKTLGPVARYAVLTACTAALLYFMSPFRAGWLIGYLQQMGGVKAGWFIPWLTPDRYLGFLPHGTLALVLPLVPRTILSLALLGLCVLGLARTFRDDPDAFCVAASTLFVVWSGYFLLALLDQEGGQLGGYKSYKFVTFFLPMLLLASWTLFRRLPSWHAVVRSPGMLVLIGVLFGANLMGDRASARAQMPHARIVDQDLAGVGAISHDEQIESVNLLHNHGWKLLWMNNFLIDKRLCFLASSYSGRAASPLNGGWDLVPRNSFWGRGNVLHWNLAVDHIDFVEVRGGTRLNDGYLLAKRRRLDVVPREFSSFSVERGEGWTTVEQGRIAIDPTAGRGKLIIRAAPHASIRFRAVFYRQPSAKALLVTFNGYQVATCEHPEFCWIDDLPIQAGDNVVELAPVARSESAEETGPDFIFSALDVFVTDSRPTMITRRAKPIVE